MSRSRAASSVERLGGLLVLGGTLSVTWTSVTVGGQMVSDLLLFCGAFVLLLMNRHRAVNPLLWRRLTTRFGASAWIIVIGVALFAGSRGAPLEELLRAGRLVLSLTVVPLVIVAFVRTIDDALSIITALLVSVGVGGLVALSDAALGLGLNPNQVDWASMMPFSADRFVALTGHPNIVGYAAASVLPMLPFVWRPLCERLGALIAVTLALAGTAGLVLSGSRGGALGVVCGVVFTSACERGRRARWIVVVGATASAMMLLQFSNSPLVTRVLGGGGAGQSDVARLENLRAVVGQLDRTLLTGDGLESMSTVHLGLLALLVSGGVVVFTGVGVWFVTMLGYVRRSLHSSAPGARDIALAAMAGGIGSLAYLVTSPFIYHRYAVIGPALALAVVNLRMIAGAEQPQPQAAPPAPSADSARGVRVSGGSLRQPR